VWKFDTKYYTADVQLTLWSEESDTQNVEAIIFYVEDSGELQGMAPKITQLYEQYQPEIGVIFQNSKTPLTQTHPENLSKILQENFLEFTYEDLTAPYSSSKDKPDAGLLQDDEA
jgi:hypothetical protein